MPQREHNPETIETLIRTTEAVLYNVRRRGFISREQVIMLAEWHEVETQMGDAPEMDLTSVLFAPEEDYGAGR